MMKFTFLTMAATAALSVAAPAAAQSWHEDSNQSAALQTQIDDGVRSGAIARRDIPALRDGLRQLVAMERQFGAGGINAREDAILHERVVALGEQIDSATQSRGYRNSSGDSRAAWEARYDRDHRAAWEARYVTERSAEYDGGYSRAPRPAFNDRFNGPNRGDRFAGDVRVGQRFSSRMTAIPAEYRTDYQDNAQVYYGYDNQRVYRVDRRTGLILGLLDLSN
ncbi:MAG: hypothetical protein ACJ8EB_00300 [Allosphingosinicella sp.]